MENEVYTSKEQIRKAGERRYGKGVLTVTDSSLILSYKKIMGKPEEYTIPKDNIEKAEITKDGWPIEFYGPGLFKQGEQSWAIFDIKTKDGQEFNLFIGDFVMMPEKMARQLFDKYKKLQELLVTPSSGSGV